MNTTFLARGRRSRLARSSRSQAMHSMPQAVSFSRKPRSEKRATPMTRLPAPRAPLAGAGRQSCQRRPHVAAAAELHDLVDAEEVALELGARVRHEILELLDIG